MKSVSSGFATLLGRNETNYCFILTLTKVNGDIIRLSNSVGNIVSDGHTFLGSPGFEMSSIVSAVSGEAPSVDIAIPMRSGGTVDRLDVKAGFYDGASIEVLALDFLQPAEGTINVFKGKINQIDAADSGLAQIRAIGFGAGLTDLIVESYTTDCQTNLGDPLRCKVNLTGFTKSAVVASVTDRRNITITVTEPRAVDGWFANGAVKFLTGGNAGLAFDVRQWVQATSHVSLWLPTNAEMQVGDTLNIAPGCNKTAATCTAKFANIINFQGFPFLPTAALLECKVMPFEQPPVGTVVESDC